MRNELNFWVVGGDMRQAKLAELLSADGHTVHTFALEALSPLEGVRQEKYLAEAELADCVVLPLPAAGEDGMLNAPLSRHPLPLAELFSSLRPGQVVCAGRVDAPAMVQAEGLGLTDYFYGDGVCLVEWAQNIADVLPENCKTVTIEKLKGSVRKIIY